MNMHKDAAPVALVLASWVHGQIVQPNGGMA